LNTALGVDPPEIASRATPRDATAFSAVEANNLAAAMAVASGVGQT
jgi:hypothetical protein